MKLKLNANLMGFKAGQIVEIDDRDGQPKDLYWRKRLRDAKSDNCVELVSSKVSTKSSTKEKKEVENVNSK